MLEGWKKIIFYPCPDVFSPKTIMCTKELKNDRWIDIVNKEFQLFLEGGLPTLGFIFSVISASILKI